MEKFKSIMRVLAWVIIIGLPLYFIIAGWGSRFGLFDWTFGFGKMIFAWGKTVMLFSLVIGIIALIASLLPARRMRPIIVAIAAILIPVGAMAYANNFKTIAGSLPFIHDVTTDTQDPPLFTATMIAARGEGANSADYIGKKDPRGTALVSELQAKGYADIAPQNFAANPKSASTAAAMVMRDNYGDVNLVQGDNETLIEGTHESFWFGFKDDIIIRIRPDDAGGSIVDMRSLSRVGGSDVGANAARIRKLQAQLNTIVD